MANVRKSRSTRADSIPAEDLEEFSAALAELLPTVELSTLPGDDLAQLAREVAHRGYSLLILPAMGRGGYVLRVPFGTRKIEVVIGAGADDRDMLRRMILVVRKLPTRE